MKKNFKTKFPLIVHNRWHNTKMNTTNNNFYWSKRGTFVWHTFSWFLNTKMDIWHSKRYKRGSRNNAKRNRLKLFGWMSGGRWKNDGLQLFTHSYKRQSTSTATCNVDNLLLQTKVISYIHFVTGPFKHSSFFLEVPRTFSVPG